MHKDLKRLVEKLYRVTAEIKDKIPYLALKDTYDDYSDRPAWWTNGFYPGILWLLYQATKDEIFSKYAISIEKKLDVILDRYLEVDHDAGFIWYLSSRNHYRFKADEHARIQTLKAASFLASRFHPLGNYIKAWNGSWAKGHAIIDTLMNLPLLYWASDQIDDPGLGQIAIAHTDMVLEHFIRKDGSVQHIVVFNPDTGIKEGTRVGQGYSHSSSWGRGTAWALYGLCIAYRETGFDRYLQAAEKVAQFIQKNLPSHKVPYADYLAPDEEKRTLDSSAGAITACGFILLSQLKRDLNYKNFALEMLEGLKEFCEAPIDSQALLLHGNVAYHTENKDEADTGIIYGDYFYLEAWTMLNNMKGFF